MLIITTPLVVASSDRLELKLDGFPELPVTEDVVSIGFCVIVNDVEGASNEFDEMLDVSGAFTEL